MQLFTVEQLVCRVASLTSSLCEQLEATSGFFQVSPALSLSLFLSLYLLSCWPVCVQLPLDMRKEGMILRNILENVSHMYFIAQWKEVQHCSKGLG